MTCDRESSSTTHAQRFFDRIGDYLNVRCGFVERFFHRETRPQAGEIPLLRPRCCRNHGRVMLP